MGREGTRKARRSIEKSTEAQRSAETKRRKIEGRILRDWFHKQMPTIESWHVARWIVLFESQITRRLPLSLFLASNSFSPFVARLALCLLPCSRSTSPSRPFRRTCFLLGLATSRFGAHERGRRNCIRWSCQWRQFATCLRNCLPSLLKGACVNVRQPNRSTPSPSLPIYRSFLIFRASCLTVNSPLLHVLYNHSMFRGRWKSFWNNFIYSLYWAAEQNTNAIILVVTISDICVTFWRSVFL